MTREYPTGIAKTTTDCCALCQLSRVNNYTPKSYIEDALAILKRQKLANTEVGITTGNGQTAVFTIVSPGEDRLEAKLISLGFNQVHTFERRKGYPKLGNLKMYIKNL